jgi:hypothetical protein
MLSRRYETVWLPKEMIPSRRHGGQSGDHPLQLNRAELAQRVPRLEDQNRSSRTVPCAACSVADTKLGFTFWKQAPVEGEIRNLYTRPVGESGASASDDTA